MGVYDVTLRQDIDPPFGAFSLPHWAQGQEVRARDISKDRNWARLSYGVRIGRPLPAAHRCFPDDPASDAIDASKDERAASLHRQIRIGGSDPHAVADAIKTLSSKGLITEIRPVQAQVFQRSPSKDPAAAVSGKPGSWALEAVDADVALATMPGDPDIRVAVLDSGISRDHKEFRGKVSGGYDFVTLGAEDWSHPGMGTLIGDIRHRDSNWDDDGGHGSHVAGTIGALGLDMPVGAAGLCSLMAYRVLGTAIENGSKVGVGTPGDIDAAVKEATDRGAHVINLSLGLGASSGLAPHARVIRYARMRNVVTVAASGNHGTSSPVYPGAVPGVITVGAIDPFGRVTAFSGWGPHLDITAPGSSIYSADLDNGYRFRDGTSHAAPFVSATAALIISLGRARRVTFKESTIRRLIRDSAQVEGRPTDPRRGAGVLNMARALKAAGELIDDHRRAREDPEPPWPFGFGPKEFAASNMRS
ncbi:S8 family peptidase [Ruegeria atlantica]|uniref:S8 family peptidase n=1 Tax=Ruegeria atlantica TaxID=81569 RepID=UPI001479CC6A|nr:S8 family serine peptidase [Ruegeria atlantica]